MADGAGEVQEAVVRLCSLWWHKELLGRENMVPQMIPYLLYQATVSGTNTVQTIFLFKLVHKGRWSMCPAACQLVSTGKQRPMLVSGGVSFQYADRNLAWLQQKE